MGIIEYLVVLVLGVAIGYGVGRYGLYRTKDLDDARLWFVVGVVLVGILPPLVWVAGIFIYGSFSILPPLLFAAAYWFSWVTAVERDLCGCVRKK